MATEILDVAKIANAKKKVTLWPSYTNVTPSHLKRVVYRLVGCSWTALEDVI